MCPRSFSIKFPVEISHIRTIQSSDPAATNRPSGETATDVTPASVKDASALSDVAVGVGVLVSTVNTRHCVSPKTLEDGDVGECGDDDGRNGARFQIRVVRSPDPDIMNRPSGEKASE